MQLIETKKGKQIYLIPTENNLRDPKFQPRWTRAQCPIHGGDHQRSLSINKQSGWGTCFQCQALVLLEEYNPQTAHDLRQKYLLSGKKEAPEQFPPTIRKDHQEKHSEKQREGEPWQREEVQALHLLQPWMQKALKSVDIGDGWQAQAYLAWRAIPLDIALHEGIGYLPCELLLYHPEFQRFQHLLNRWTERIIIPLRSPEGNGYIGRSLWGWQIGMNEDEHKALLNDESDAPKRYIKTNPAGWFCSPPVEWSPCVTIVEGPFDRLAAIAAGMKPTDVHALVGTAVNVDWIPDHVAAILLALDPDPSGKEAMERSAEAILLSKEVLIETVLPLDEMEHDWSSRWTTFGYPGVAPLIDVFERIRTSYPTSESFRQRRQ